MSSVYFPVKKQASLSSFNQVMIDLRPEIMQDKEHQLFYTAIKASVLAGNAIMEVYKSDFDVELKNDLSPLTIADKRAHQIISDLLKETELPVLSEEGKEIPFDIRRSWKKFWMVDPLDGTKEFIKRNGEFTVNIALIEDNYPKYGIIYVPVNGDLFFGGKGFGSHKLVGLKGIYGSFNEYLEQSLKLPLISSGEVYRMIGSRSHMSDETKKYFDEVSEKKGEVQILSKGSSLKLCMIAEGEADEYPRFAPTMEWDTAAGQAIIEGAGRRVFHYESGTSMRYNKENLLNDWFVAKSE